MTDYGAFKYGAVAYPIPLSGSGLGGAGASFLRDADPALFYVIEFYKAMIETYIGARLLQEAAAVGLTKITAPVAEWLPLDPEPYLLESHVRFPLLAAYRKASKFEWYGRSKNIVDEVEVVYCLPPMTPAESERMLPSLHAIARLLDSRTEQGFDPNYTPSAPTGTAGESWWKRAGLTGAGFKSATYGSFMSAESLYFPAVVMTLELKEQSAYDVAALEQYTGVDVHEDVVANNEPTLTDFIQFAVNGPPDITLASPNNGTKVGGNTVTLLGTNFTASTNPRIFFDDVPAKNVVVVNSTTITCLAPAHDAFPTAIVDIYLVDDTGYSDVLVAGYTYTTP